MRCSIVMVALGLAAASAAGGQEPASSAGEVAPVTSRARLSRDPFSRPQERPLSLTRGPGSLEAHRLRTLVLLRGGRAGALVEVGGRRWLVRPGEQLPGAGGEWWIEAIERRGLRLRAQRGGGEVREWLR